MSKSINFDAFIESQLVKSAYSANNLSLNDLLTKHQELLNSKSDIKMKERIQNTLLSLLVFVIVGLFYLIISQGIKRLLFSNSAFNVSNVTLHVFISGGVIVIYWLLDKILKYHFSGPGFLDRILDYFLNKNNSTNKFPSNIEEIY